MANPVVCVCMFMTMMMVVVITTTILFPLLLITAAAMLRSFESVGGPVLNLGVCADPIA